jgi:hypothetical protein
MVTANERVLAGGSDHATGGDALWPSQVNSTGYAPPFWKAELLRVNAPVPAWMLQRAP